MMESVTSGSNVEAMSDAEKLCSILLEVAGRDTNRLPSVKRHVRALDAALPFMSSAQAKLARARIRHHEARWGSLLAGDQGQPENTEISPMSLITRWLSVRRAPERHLRLLHRTAKAVGDGETSLSRIMDAAYAPETDHVLFPVSLDSFREWLIQLRIARRKAGGGYVPGLLCSWWSEEMDPDAGPDGAFAACLKQLRQLKNSVGNSRMSCYPTDR